MMKVRNDFVTNSSSSSFVIAKKEGLSEKQKEAVINYIECVVLGDCILTPESSEEEIQNQIDEEYDILGRNEAAVRKSLKEGKSIYTGWVSFEESEYYYAEFYQDIWELLEQNSDGKFDCIDTRLDY